MPKIVFWRIEAVDAADGFVYFTISFTNEYGSFERTSDSDSATGIDAAVLGLVESATLDWESSTVDDCGTSTLVGAIVLVAMLLVMVTGDAGCPWTVVAPQGSSQVCVAYTVAAPIVEYSVKTRGGAISW